MDRLGSAIGDAMTAATLGAVGGGRAITELIFAEKVSRN
jgi:hypothetical protein